MSTFDSNDLETMGYFLPEDSQLRLKKLREYAEFLSHIAQPRTADVQQEWIPEINVGEVAVCLEWLAEQVGLVLDEMSWPAYRSEREAALGAGALRKAGVFSLRGFSQNIFPTRASSASNSIRNASISPDVNTSMGAT